MARTTTAKKGKGKAKAKTKAGDKALVTTEDTGADIIDADAIRCKKAIEGALDGLTKNFFQLALGLHEAWEKDYAPKWGYDNFRLYVEGRLEMKYRRSMYLIDCAKAIKALNLSEDQVKKIGWTRFKEIAPIIQKQPGEATKYLTMAEEMSSRELQEALKEEGSKVSKTDPKNATPGGLRMSLLFKGDAMSVVSDALNAAYGELGSEDINGAFNHICAEWLMSKGSSSEVASLEDWIGYLEKTYGVKLGKLTGDDDIGTLLEGEGETISEDAELDALLEGDDGNIDDMLNG